MLKSLYALMFISLVTVSHAQLFNPTPAKTPTPLPTAIQSFKPYWSKGPIYIWSNPIKLSASNQITESAPRAGFFAVNTQLGPRWIGVTEADVALIKMKIEAAAQTKSLPYVELLAQQPTNIAATVASSTLQSEQTQQAIEKHKKAMQIMDAAIAESMTKLTK